MRVWLPEDLAAELAQALAPFETREARMRGLRRVKYRHLLRIGARDLLGDADLAVTTAELAHLADACLAEALAFAEAAARVAYGAPRDATGAAPSSGSARRSSRRASRPAPSAWGRASWSWRARPSTGRASTLGSSRRSAR